MLLSLKHMLCFIKGMKVAGSSLEIYVAPHLEDAAVVTPMGGGGMDLAAFGALWRPRNYVNQHGLPNFYDHMPATQVRSIVGTWVYERLFKFGVVRHPLAKVKSFFYEARMLHGSEYTLDDAICECSSEVTRLTDAGEVIVHRVIPYELLTAELTEILPVHGIPFDGVLPIKARSKARQTYAGETIAFDQRQLDAIHTKFAFEFSLYDSWRLPLPAE